MQFPEGLENTPFKVMQQIELYILQFHEIDFEQINLTRPMCAFQDDSNCEQEAAWFVDLYSLPRDQVVKKPKINWPKTVIDKKRGLNYVQ